MTLIEILVIIFASLIVIGVIITTIIRKKKGKSIPNLFYKARTLIPIFDKIIIRKSNQTTRQHGNTDERLLNYILTHNIY